MQIGSEKRFGLRALAALTEDWSLEPSTCIWQLTTACNPSARAHDALLWPLQAPALTCAYTHIKTKINLKMLACPDHSTKIEGQNPTEITTLTTVGFRASFREETMWNQWGKSCSKHLSWHHDFLSQTLELSLCIQSYRAQASQTGF